MNLPNYFLADLPREATLTPQMIGDACQTLKRNRELYLAERNTPAMMRRLSGLAENWLDAEYPFRKHVLAEGPAATGFSRATLAHGLDIFFREITEDKLRVLIVQELGHVQRLDAFNATPADTAAQRSAFCRGPELLVHVTGGCLPNPVLTSMILGVLLRSAQFVKCASGTSFIPRMFAHSLYEADAKLGACLELAEWRGGNVELEKALFHEADSVTATGSDETLEKIHAHVPKRMRFIGYGHRISFAFIAKDGLDSLNLKKLIADAARDVVAWDQLGCLSPHVIYVENGGSLSPEQFAERLAKELARLEIEQPRGALPPETAAGIASKRAFYEIRAAHSPDTQHWWSENSTAWTVIYENDPRFQLSCLNRFIYVKSVASLTEALQGADAVRNHVSTVGLAAAEETAPSLALQLAKWGATRICPVGRMQEPSLSWRHDGRPSLGDLVTWTDWEQPV